MKQTKENILKLLQAKKKHYSTIAKLHEKNGDMELAKEYRNNAFEVETIIWLFTDKDFYNEQYKILVKE